MLLLPLVNMSYHIAPPTGLKVISSTKNSITLQWDMLDSSVEEYVIEYRAPDKTVAWNVRYELDYTQNTGTIVGLESGTMYEFRIRIETAAGYSAHSNVVTAITNSY